jgi:hypothetical protein
VKEKLAFEDLPKQV